jgi:hypothetical protein
LENNLSNYGAGASLESEMGHPLLMLNIKYHNDVRIVGNFQREDALRDDSIFVQLEDNSNVQVKHNRLEGFDDTEWINDLGGNGTIVDVNNETD